MLPIMLRGVFGGGGGGPYAARGLHADGLALYLVRDRERHVPDGAGYPDLCRSWILCADLRHLALHGGGFWCGDLVRGRGGGVRSIGHVLRARRTGTGCGSSAGRDFVDTFAAVCIAENYFAFTVLRSPLLLCCSARCCSPLSCPALLCSSTRQPRRTRLTWTPSRPTPQYSRSQPASNAAANEAVARRNLSNSLGNGNSGLML